MPNLNLFGNLHAAVFEKQLLIFFLTDLGVLLVSLGLKDHSFVGRPHLFPVSELSSLDVTFVDILYIFDDINSLTESDSPLSLFVICPILFIFWMLQVFMKYT